MLGLPGAGDRSNPAKRRIGDAGRPGVSAFARRRVCAMRYAALQMPSPVRRERRQ
jgi:hypothetical protein